MKKFLMTTALAASLILGSISANAATTPTKANKMMPPPPPGHMHMHKPMSPERKAEMEKRRAEIDQRLGITEEQKAQLKAIHEKSKAEIAPKIKQLTAIEHEISVIERQQINKDKYGINTLEDVKLSGKSLDQLKAEAKILRDEIRKIKKDNFEASQKIFTEEQKKELEKMRQEHTKNIKKQQKIMDKKTPIPLQEK